MKKFFRNKKIENIIKKKVFLCRNLLPCVADSWYLTRGGLKETICEEFCNLGGDCLPSFHYFKRGIHSRNQSFTFNYQVIKEKISQSKWLITKIVNSSLHFTRKKFSLQEMAKEKKIKSYSLKSYQSVNSMHNCTIFHKVGNLNDLFIITK